MLSYKLFVVKDTIKKIYGKIFTKRNAKIFIMLAIFVGICNLTYYRVNGINIHDKILQVSIEYANEKNVELNRIMSERVEEQRKEIERNEKICEIKKEIESHTYDKNWRLYDQKDHELYHLERNEVCVKKFCTYSTYKMIEEMK